ncbi:hypothetical protein ON010_g12108 [Phytophthora cinnamomi]|nr:hypothetical protein ON010_g12108 [Phytophthora cinnamomi]
MLRSSQRLAATRSLRLPARRAIASYAEQYRRSLDRPEEFWADAARDIEWFKPWTKALDTTRGPSSRWFTGGEMNTSYNALDVHVNSGRGDVVAFHYDSPLTSTKTTVTLQRLCLLTVVVLAFSLAAVSTFAGGLQKLGVKKGDRVVIYMPAVLETTVAMLACARLGAVHSVVFGGFATLELAARIEDATPKVIISASCGVEPKGIIDYGPLLNGAIERSAWKPSKVVMMQRDLCPFPMTKGRDVDWRDVMAMGSPIDAVPVLATDPLYILYTSGTTGRPKGVVRDNGGHAVALKWAMRNVFDITPDDTFFAASDMGWTVGHSLVVYGPLVHGCTSVLYAGKPVGTPDAGAYWRLITEYGIKSMFTAPTALRAIRKEDPHALLLKDKKEEIRKTFKTMFVAGERGDPKTFNFFSEELGVPLIDHWWQTETGWPITAPCIGMQNDDITEDGYPRIKVGSVARPVPGWDVQLLTADRADHDEHHGHNHENEEQDAELVVKLPLPPGALTTLHNNPDDFYAKYFKRFPGYYHTGDTGHIDEEGFVYVMSRTDDVINVAGHRITTGSIEEVIIEIPEVVECAVFGVVDALKGHVPVALLVIDKKIDRSKKEIIEQVVRDVREQMGSFVCLKDVGLVDALPKTRSGKVMRATIQAVANSAPFRVPATIDNVAVLDDIRGVLQKLGYAKKKSLVAGKDGKIRPHFSIGHDDDRRCVPRRGGRLPDSDEASSTDAVPTVQNAPKSQASSVGSRGTKKQPLCNAEAAAKLEMDRAKDRKRRSAYRERRRVEKETLQQQVGDLSTELLNLQKARQAERSLASSAWEMVSKRQLQARLNAEEKQRRLIQAVESHASAIEDLKGLHDRLCIADDVGETVYKPKRIRLEPSDAEFYKAFVEELDGIYSQTDEMLSVYGLDSTDASWERPRRQWKEEGENGYYVYTDMHVMPFDFEQICKYTWQVAQMAHRQKDREHYDGVQNPENTSAFKFRITTRLNSGRDVSVLEHAVVRRYLKDDRSVVVWRSLTEGEGIFAGMHAAECGCNAPRPDAFQLEDSARA